MASNRTSLERVSDTEIVITRTFRAPAQLVFDAWTTPEYLKRWWAPASRGVSLVQCDADLRPGGAYRYVLARGQTERMAFFGKYLEIVPPFRELLWSPQQPGIDRLRGRSRIVHRRW